MQGKGPSKRKRSFLGSKKCALAVLIILVLAGIAALGIYWLKDKVATPAQAAESAEALQKAASTVSGTGNQFVVSKEQQEQEAIKEKLRKGQTDGLKVVFLSFDDGPSENTNAVLDILKEYNVKGTFFTRGREGDVAVAGYKRIVSEGHTLGNHTYNHAYNLYKQPDAFYADVQKMDDYEKQITGTEPSKIFRFPGGSANANKTCCQGILDRGYNYVDWNVSSGDAAPTTPDVQSIVAAVVGGCHQHSVSVVLCHAESKANTREALPQIITNLKNEGYTFLPMAYDYTYPRQLEP